jgi:hypothetical protein
MVRETSHFVNEQISQRRHSVAVGLRVGEAVLGARLTSLNVSSVSLSPNLTEVGRVNNVLS